MKKITACYLVAMLLVGCATGSALVTGEGRTPTDPSQVKLYLQPPGNYEPVGIVTASSEVGWTKQDLALQELRQQAAKIGANGILLTYYRIPEKAKSVTGQAIYVFE